MTIKTLLKLTALGGLLAWATPARAGKYVDTYVSASSGAYFVGYDGGSTAPAKGKTDRVFTSSGAAVVQSTSSTSAHKVLSVRNQAGTDILSMTQGGTLTAATLVGNVTGNASGTAGSLAANGANCTAGNFPLGVDASGAVESCTAVAALVTGTPVQVAFASTTVSGVGTSNDMVLDTTIPQVTEGDQVFASTMTPLYSTSRLRVQASTWITEDSNTSSSGLMCCLFRDATANSIGGCQWIAVNTNGEGSLNDHFNYSGETIVNSNATSPTVFSLRCGLFGAGAASSIRWCGEDGAQLLGGACSTNIVVTEIY